MNRYVYLFFLVLSVAFSHSLFAVNRTWTGTTSTDWNTASNWNPSGIPTASDILTINDVTNDPIIFSGTANAQKITLNSGGILTVANGASLNVTTSVAYEEGIAITQGSLINNGTVTLLGLNETGYGFTFYETATLTNNGTINCSGSYSAFQIVGTNSSILNNSSGVINYNTPKGLYVYLVGVSITNNGSINYSADGYCFTLENNSSFTNSGNVNASGNGISISTGSTFSNQSCGKFILTPGLYGSGNFEISSSTVNNTGLIQIAGTLTRSGGSFTNNGVLKYGSLSGTIVSNTNASLIVKDTPTPIFTYGGTYNGTVNGIYTNAAATTSAGTFTAPNTFTPSGLSNGSQTLYAKITPSGGACSYVVPFTYNYVAPPSFTTNPTTKTVCTGTGTTFTVAASGSPTYQWQVNTGGSFTNLTNTAPYSGVTGTTLTISNVAGLNGYQYRCVATNGGGSTNSTEATLTVSSLPTAGISPSSTTITCANPTVTLTASGGGTYRWDNNSTNAIRNVTTGGTYSVTVTNASGCTATASQTITTNTTPPTAGISPSSTTITCANPTVTLTASGGGTYRWDNNSTNAIRSVTTGGTYSVTVTATNGCTATASQTITTNTTPPTAGISPSSTTITCANPTVTLTASGGVSYRWDNNSTNAIRSVTTGGTYSVTVTNASGCTATASQTITTNTTPPTAGISPSSTTITCANPTVTLTASGGGTYRWDNNSTNAIRNVTTGGTYSVTVTNASGCTATASQTITTNTTPPTAGISPSSTTITCANPTVTLTASGGGTYRWDNNSTNAIRSVTTGGTYSVTVTNASGCTATASQTITTNTTPPTAGISPSSTTITCANPTVTLTASGGGTYRWDNNSTNAIRNVTTGGTYSVTVTSANGCTATTSIQIQQDNSMPTVSISPTSATLTCANPTATLTANGTGTYQWSTGATSQTISIGSSGTYSVTLTADNGCFASTSIQVQQDNTPPSVSISPTSTTLTCTNPSATLTANGVGTYQWSTGATSQTITASSAGTYSVTLTGSNGCSATASLPVQQDTDLPTVSITPSSATLTCANPSATLTANGVGTYRWSTGATSQTITASSAGTYSVTLTGSNGCSASASLSISADQNAPQLSISPTSATLTCTTPTVSLTAVGTGAVLWSTGSTDRIIPITSAGTYSVTLTSSGGCTTATSVTVSQDNTASSVSITASSTTLTCATPSVTLTANGTGTYLWNTGATSQTITATAAGTYSVTLTGSNGCSATATASVTADQATPPLSITASQTLLTCASPSASLTAIGTGSVLWSTGSTDRILSVNTGGTYSVTLTAPSGCTTSTSITINQNTDLPTLSITPSSATLTCANPTATLTANGVGTYQWSTGATSQTISVGSSGTYSVTLTSPNGCTATASVLIQQDTDLPTVSITPGSATLTCASPSVALTANGTGTYRWSTGATSKTITASSAGTYSVTLTGSNGCSNTASISVTADQTAPSLSISPSSATLTCANPTATLTALGTGSVRWSTGSTDPQIQVSTAGTYSVTLTTPGGCTATTSVLIQQDNTVPTVSISPTSATLTCTNPSATLTANGTGTYRWSTGATSQTITASSAGTYSVTLTSGNGCFAAASVLIQQDTGLPTVSITPGSATLTCARPSVVLTANGTGTYRWSTGATSQTITASSAGTYSVTLTANNGCQATASITLEQGADQTIAFSQQPASASSVTVGSTVITQVVITGQASAFQWYKDNLSQPLASQTADQLTLTNVQLSDAGSYFVVVTGPCNSLTSTAFMLSVTNPVTSLSLTASVSPNPIQTGQSATLTAILAGGTSPYSYSFSGPGSINPTDNTATVSGLPAGVYSFTVKASDSALPTNQQATSVVSLTVTAVETAPFAITGVTTISCSPITPNRFSVSFNPRYSGLTGQPVSFSVANELLPTTQSGPYTLQLYTDNPAITLQATQQATPTSASFSYNWLEACRTSENPNTPPRVVNGLPSQTAKVGDYLNYVIPEGTFTDSETPLSLRLSASGLPAGLSFAGATLSGVPSTTVGSPFTVSITATDPGGLSVSTPLVITVLPATGPVEPTAPFAITGVTTISCTPIADRINISFAPLYSGLNGQSIAFEVVNERAPTTDPAPYSLTLYRDNPIITLRARQTGSEAVASFSYNWLAACSTAGQDNTPPRLNSPVGSQTATVGQAFNLNLANVFVDQETPNQLTLVANGLPAGLVLAGTAISGRPSVSGVSTVILTAIDGGGLSTQTSFGLTVSPASSTTVTPPSGFAITGVQTLSCVTVSAGLRSVSFQPQYGGVTGQSISFGVANELATTTASGPYTLNLYTDNPVLTLKATQSGSTGEASYSYNWLAACSAPARVGTPEAQPRLEVTVLGNPVEGEQVEVEIRSAPQQTIHLDVTDLQGNRISQKTVDSESGQQRVSVRLGSEIGTYLLRVSNPTQQQTIKIIRH